MTDILIRGLSAETIQRLKERAKRNGRSLQSELKLLLKGAEVPEKKAPAEEIKAILAHWGKVFAGRKFDSSVDLIREDRDR